MNIHLMGGHGMGAAMGIAEGVGSFDGGRLARKFGGAFVPIGAWILLSAAVAEFFGYLLHRLLHSEAIPFLSRNHLLHHLKHYGPLGPMRKAEYIDATEDRPSIGNVGLEWLLPSGLLIAMFLGIFSIFHADWSHRALFVTIAVGWSVFMFNFLHDWMHVEGFWMERQSVMRKWFLAARRLHDIHHYSLDDEGRMNMNFGIGFSCFDRFFGTRCERLTGLNQKGLSAVRERYDFLRVSEND